MAHIAQVSDKDATGKLKSIYESAVKRAGKVFNIVRLQSLNPESLQASLNLYMATMHASSPLSRADREMLATVVSRANSCHY
ncbi:MAG TPA: carboxymuconolactone decarboxylase family protein [Acidobacteriota bacterium]|jgi:uncharacterized peroxidase-related enzyme